MRVDLTGRPIVITGASSGIGAATAIACAAAGMPVALGARRADRLADIVSRIERSGGRAVAVASDVTDPAACESLVAECEKRFGSVYAVYANAGYGDEVAMHDMSDERLRAIFEANFFGTTNTIRPALAAMRRAEVKAGGPRGHILICSSCLARFSVPYFGAYCATKAAQAHVGTAMRFELRPERIHVTTIHPIGTRTELFDKITERSGPSRLSIHTANGFMQRPEFVAARTVAALRRPRAEVWTGFSGVMVRVGMSLGTMMPGISDRMVSILMARRARHAPPDPSAGAGLPGGTGSGRG